MKTKLHFQRIFATLLLLAVSMFSLAPSEVFSKLLPNF
jgi:hypothetical protein